MPESQSNTQRALVGCSLWLNSGLVGLVALAVGLLQLIDGEPKLPWALALAFSGGLLAAASWRRARKILETERAASVASGAPNESASRDSSKQIGAIALLSPIPLQWTRRRNHDLRYPAPE